MITNESLLFVKYFFSWSKIRKNVFKLNRLVGLIFGNIKFWRPIRPEGRQNLTEYQMDLKMVSKRPQRILMNLQLLFESVLLVIFVTNSVNVLGGALCAPPTLFRVKQQFKQYYYYAERGNIIKQYKILFNWWTLLTILPCHMNGIIVTFFFSMVQLFKVRYFITWQQKLKKTVKFS